MDLPRLVLSSPETWTHCSSVLFQDTLPGRSIARRRPVGDARADQEVTLSRDGLSRDQCDHGR